MTDGTVKRMIDMMKVFAVQTVLLPLIFLWLLRAACGSLLSAPGGQAPVSRRDERQGLEA